MGLYKVCNDCSCPTCGQHALSHLETPSPSTDSTSCCAGSLPIFCIPGAFQGNCSFSFLVTWKRSQEGHWSHKEELPFPSKSYPSLLFSSFRQWLADFLAMMESIDRKPDNQMIHSREPIRTATIPFMLKGQGLVLTQRGKISPYDLGKLCCQQYALALQSTTWQDQKVFLNTLKTTIFSTTVIRYLWGILRIPI